MDKISQLKESLGSQDWVLHESDLDPAGGAFKGPVVYLCDVFSGHMILCGFIENGIDIAITANRSQKKPLRHADACNYLTSVIKDISEDNSILNQTVSNALHILTALYLSETQCYEISRKLPYRQFVILRYIDASTKAFLLRPVCFNRKDIASPEEIEALVRKILDIDRANHPERFSNADLTPYHCKRRFII